MTVLEAIQRSTEFLTGKGVESPRLQTELLLAHVLKLKRMELYLRFDRQLEGPDVDVLRELVRRRGKREPLQHIVGSTSFCGLELMVNGSALVPRPETELLAERGWQFLLERARSSSESTRALDLGTGTGCLVIAIASHCQTLEAWAVDVSEQALELARKNAAIHGMSDRVHFLHTNGFPLNGVSGPFDLVISNPPYIPSAEIDNLEPEVRDHDPRLALDGGADGLEYYRRIAVQAGDLLKPGGKLMLELGDGQADRVSEILRQQNWIVESVVQDYSQQARLLVGSRA
jgi:release factor glutamine methyltransferase